jgi:hypothetical protein
MFVDEKAHISDVRDVGHLLLGFTRSRFLRIAAE